MTVESPLQGKVALVSGGARGIGRGVVEALARAGADVGFSFLTDRSAATATEAAVVHLGRRALGVASDAARPDAVEALVETVTATFGRLDLVVANAGIAGPLGWDAPSLDDWHRLVETNLIGPYTLMRAASRDLTAASGSAVLVASIAGLLPYPEEIVYAATKAGVLSVTRSLSLALAPRVRVNAIAPGWIRTDMTRELHENARASAGILRGIPLGRWGETEDVAAGVVFLLSDGARFITGETLVVDGGNALTWSMDGRA